MRGDVAGVELLFHTKLLDLSEELEIWFCKGALIMVYCLFGIHIHIQLSLWIKR